MTSLNVGANVALQPVVFPTVAPALVPTFYGTGSAEECLACVPTGVLERYEAATTTSKVYAMITGGTHGEPAYPARWNPYGVSFFNCHLLDI
jgi:hypothetical protein